MGSSNWLSSSQMSAKYGVPSPDPGASFAKDEYKGPGRVLPHAAQNMTTVGRRTTWESQLGTGPGSFINFGDNNSSTPPPPSIGG